MRPNLVPSEQFWYKFHSFTGSRQFQTWLIRKHNVVQCSTNCHVKMMNLRRDAFYSQSQPNLKSLILLSRFKGKDALPYDHNSINLSSEFYGLLVKNTIETMKDMLGEIEQDLVPVILVFLT